MPTRPPQLLATFKFPSNMSTTTSTLPTQPPTPSPSEKSPTDTTPGPKIEGRKVLPPPPPQSPFRQFVDRRVTGVMQILGLI